MQHLCRESENVIFSETFAVHAAVKTIHDLVSDRERGYVADQVSNEPKAVL